MDGKIHERVTLGRKKRKNIKNRGKSEKKGFTEKNTEEDITFSNDGCEGKTFGIKRSRLSILRQNNCNGKHWEIIKRMKILKDMPKEETIENMKE